MTERERDYCYFLDHRKYDRNIGCRAHDNAYGIYGGGGEYERRGADFAFYQYMREKGDPMAVPALIACRFYGWFFFNYHAGRWLWRGQAVRRFVKAKT